MPASLTHLLTGRAALPLLAPENPSLYYLGCVVPDAPNLDGFASKEVRWASHLRAKDAEQWMENVVHFLKNTKADRSYALGYAVHVTGDVVWDELFEKSLQKAIHAEQFTGEERFRLRWREHHRFEQEQLCADWWQREVKPMLTQAVPMEINGLSPELACRWRDYLENDYVPAPSGDMTGFVTMPLVEEFSLQIIKKLRHEKIYREESAVYDEAMQKMRRI